MSTCCVKCGKPIKEASPGNGLYCRDCFAGNKKDTILLTDDPRVVSVYREAADKTVSVKDNVLARAERSQPVKTQKNDHGDGNDHTVSLRAGHQVSDVQTSQTKNNNSKLIFIAVGVLAAEVIATVLFFLDGQILYYILAQITEAVAIFVTGIAAKKTNEFTGGIIVAVGVLVTAMIAAAVFTMRRGYIVFVLIALAFSSFAQIAAVLIFVITLKLKKGHGAGIKDIAYEK